MPRGQLSEKNTTMSFAIPKDLKAKIGIIAQKENRSMSNLIVSLVNCHYAKDIVDFCSILFNQIL